MRIHKQSRVLENIKIFTVAFVVLAMAIYGASQSLRVEAAGNRLGTPQVTLNPGGGALADGSDGLRFTVNTDQNYTSGASYNSAIEGQDGVVYRGTYQYCCSAGGPMLNIDGTLYGQAGPAQGSADWDSIQIISSGGAASVGARTASTGNSSATIRYTAVHEGRSYSIDRTVGYFYPNDFVTDSYSFVIPQGNTGPVKFYIGGDTAPGSSDQGYGIMLTEPVRSIISLNTSSQIMFGFREIAGSRQFDGATSQSFYDPYPTVQNGGNIGFIGTASNHDAGLMMQWNLGSTPGTYTGKFEQFATKQGTNLNAVFAQPRADVDEGVNLNISIVNSELESVNNLGYTMTLPSGVNINGSPTSSCGGTLTTDTESSPYSISLSGVSLAGASNCVVSVPVSASTPGSYAITSANASNLLGALTNNIGVSRLNVAVYTLSYATGGGTSVNDSVYELGQTATIGSTTRPGYTFNGWNTLANGSGTNYAAGGNLTMPANDMTLYAQWQAIPYSLAFNTQGGSAIASQGNLSTGTEVELGDAQRQGHEFIEWNTAADGTGTSYEEGNIFTMPVGNTTLYAIWVQQITVSYDTQGGDAVTASQGRLGGDISVEDAPSRDGYTFIEWNTAADGAGGGYDEGSQLILPANDMTLYAIWEDSDNISMETENAAPNNGDANNDAIRDSQQASVSSFVNTVTQKPVTLAISSDDECFIGDASVKAASDLGGDADYTYPLGLLDFVVECGADGFTATVKQYYYDAPVENFVLRKYLDGQYATVNGANIEMQTIGGRQALVVTYTVTDGGPLDADGTVNGIVVDPAGPAVVSSSADLSGNIILTDMRAPNTGFGGRDMTLYIIAGAMGLVTLGAAGIAVLRRKSHGSIRSRK